MCLILFGFKASREYDLVLAANRDEFYSRQTAPMHFWKESPDLLAGKDLEQGGTWFGITRQGRFAALTNFRDPAAAKHPAPSRGGIILDFLESDIPADEFGKELGKKAGVYNGYNLLFGTGKNIFWFSSVKKKLELIAPGIHGLSNRFLDTPWPKVETGKKELEKAVRDGASEDVLFSVLKNRTVPDDHLLPDTGVGLVWERLLSPLFIQSDAYGTRSSTVLKIGRSGRTEVFERTYGTDGGVSFSDRCFQW